LKTINHLFSSKNQFETFLVQQKFDLVKECFIQVFIGHNDQQKLRNTLSIISEVLPNASIIATSTAGEIIDGGMTENTIVVSITTFEATKVKLKLIEGDSEEAMAKEILSSMVTSKTKLILMFNNVYANDAEILIESLQEELLNIKIAGGNAGDNGEFSFSSVVGINKEVSTTAVAVATFDSDLLQVHNEYLFNWDTIGEAMTITRADKNIVYEINHQKVVDIYRKFLGDEVVENLPLSGVEFPLIFNKDNIDIARAPVALGEDGSLVMAGHIEEGTTVRFGFGDLSKNDACTINKVASFAKNPIESIFIYSCSARKYFLQDHLNNEFEMLQQIAPTAGFITYGEFFKKNRCNKLLNVSSTFIGLSETSKHNHKVELKRKVTSPATKTLNALTHLIKVTSKNLDQQNNRLQQFKHLIKESTLYSSTDLKGTITNVNKQFEELSGYTRDELIGKNHNIVRHEDMPAQVYKEMWQTIQDKKSWQGIIKNKSKNGKAYYVRSNIYPILDADSNIVEYLSIRDDITKEIQKQEQLEGSLYTLKEKTKEKEYLLSQYEKIINLSSAFFRMDSEYKILYVNDVFCDIYYCSNKKMQEKKLSEILDSDFFTTHFQSINDEMKSNGTWHGVVPFKREDGSIIHMSTSANTIYDKNNKLIEIMVVLHDITDLITAQKEIEDTQKDVVFTMGSIGETRSKETGNHVKRVAEYSYILALAYGLSEEDAQLLKMASPMHDIGKVGIPDAILNKPGKLTDDEWKIMKTHAALGYQMLKNSKREILQAAAIVSHTHHEQWDGNGYPKKLKGEGIHIYGRITAIADVFDALGSDRCYKKAWEDEKIFELLKDGSGKHFDPKLVEIFFKHLDSFLEIRSKFID